MKDDRRGLPGERTLVVVGHSHTVAMGIPFTRSGPVELVRIPGGPDNAYGVQGRLPRDDAYWNYVAQIAPSKTIAISWLGNQAAEFLYKSDPEFDFYVESLDRLAVMPDARLLPYALVQDYFRGSLDELHALLKLLTSLEDVQVVVLGTPPPKKSDEFLRSKLSTEPHFVEMAKALGLNLADAPLTSAAVRAKLWAVIQDLLANAAADHGLRFLPSPEECAEDGCYLREQFAELDVTHANTAYGSAVWENLSRHCSTPPRPRSTASTASAGAVVHPYKTAPNRAFWSRAVSHAFEPTELLPLAPRLISRKDRVASAGSCFASNIVPHLEKAGLHYVREEQRHPAFSQVPADHLGYEKFSASYGNIYTVRQALQLLRRARGDWKPQEDRWHIGGEVIDPYRPGLKYRAASDREFDLLTAQHLRAVRRAFESATVFIFTLGLTEAWTSTLDGAVFPACPGTVAGVYDAERHQFENFSVAEVASDLDAFITELRHINRALRFILTVSPVPLVATATADHVLLASTYSKSVLRVAAQQACQAHPDVCYFPAYEIITGPQAPASFFEADFRNVSAAGVDCVMSALISHCDVQDVASGAAPPAAGPSATPARQLLGAAIAKFECEEQAMDDRPT